jgi:hypothetical protein
MQTFFAEKQYIRYFVVEQTPKRKQASRPGSAAHNTTSLKPAEEDFFKSLDEDAIVAEQDAKANANIVHGFDSHKSAVVPWLRRTGIAECWKYSYVHYS